MLTGLSRGTRAKRCSPSTQTRSISRIVAAIEAIACQRARKKNQHYAHSQPRKSNIGLLSPPAPRHDKSTQTFPASSSRHSANKASSQAAAAAARSTAALALIASTAVHPRTGKAGHHCGIVTHAWNRASKRAKKNARAQTAHTGKNKAGRKISPDCHTWSFCLGRGIVGSSFVVITPYLLASKPASSCSMGTRISCSLRITQK